MRLQKKIEYSAVGNLTSDHPHLVIEQIIDLPEDWYVYFINGPNPNGPTLYTSIEVCKGHRTAFRLKIKANSRKPCLVWFNRLQISTMIKTIILVSKLGWPCDTNHSNLRWTAFAKKKIICIAVTFRITLIFALCACMGYCDEIV